MKKVAAITRKDPLNDALRGLGLSEGEISLYRFCLEFGPLPLSRLAAKLQISRPNIYKLVHRLASHGLAQVPVRNSTKRFSVTSPSRIAELLEEKRRKELSVQSDLLRSLPDLLSKYKRGDLPSTVRLYQGHSQYLSAFFGMLNEARGSCDFFGSVDNFLKLVNADEQKRWLNERISRGISAKTLTLDGPTARRISKEDSETMRETRILKEMGNFQSSFHLYADKVIFWQPESLLAVGIEDDIIASMFRSIFNCMWEQGTQFS